jgi:hypothetical protein
MLLEKTIHKRQPNSAPAASERQLQAELDHSHIRTDAANLSHPRAVRSDGIGADEADIGWRSEVRCVKRVEQLGSKLKSKSLCKLKILEQRKIDIPLAR